jgi:hypothetical protein
MANIIQKISQPSVSKRSSIKTKTTTSRFMQPLAVESFRADDVRPIARDGHCSLVWGRWLMVFGGDRHQMSFNDLLRIDLGLM